jgi:hypothetical protein
MYIYIPIFVDIHTRESVCIYKRVYIYTHFHVCVYIYIPIFVLCVRLDGLCKKKKHRYVCI